MKKRIAVVVVFVSLWTLFVLYPNPYRLGVSGARIVKPVINPDAVSHLLEELPETPGEIEAYVLREIVPYQYDWQSYGVPFYFPRVEEVLARGRGDCKSRFVVLASIFEALDIPYERSFSLSHFWITYEGKEESSMESVENAFLVQGDEGVSLQIPRESLQDTYDTLRAGFWDAMPGHRKGLLLMGPPLSLFISAFVTAKEQGAYRFRGKALVFSNQLKATLKESRESSEENTQTNEA
ncbi:transglutaminase domain-containing protein [Isachenkonia alkalipeptolytica]|uniref:Transglutaminase domain-containing protein n=1 Tax=Isachenkonia alkalipeptolytica TaxID=2565777 RepID=A0AA43XKX3_9CLOT|nr:transglutaminase domain-containing protein [Isachenkonia alkalipeptolytica]NBG88261.1 transglutaminase domain-containing protein [Isachenkonia alkalipeptolytica]